MNDSEVTYRVLSRIFHRQPITGGIKGGLKGGANLEESGSHPPENFGIVGRQRCHFMNFFFFGGGGKVLFLNTS